MIGFVVLSLRDMVNENWKYNFVASFPIAWALYRKQHIQSFGLALVSEKTNTLGLELKSKGKKSLLEGE